MAKGIRILAVTVCLVTLLSTAEALRCYHCNNCGDDTGIPYECSSPNNVCTKINLAGRIQKSCAMKAACSLGAVERGVVNAWNNVKNYFSDVDEDEPDIPDDAETTLIQCCETDECNTASSKIANPLLITLLLGIYLLRR